MGVLVAAIDIAWGISTGVAIIVVWKSVDEPQPIVCLPRLAEKAEKEALKTATDGGSKDGTKGDTAKKGDKPAKPSGKVKKSAKRTSD